MEATDVGPAGTFKALQAKHERIEARKAAEAARSASPRYVDALSPVFLPALQAKDPRIASLTPETPSEATLGARVDPKAARAMGIKRRSAELVTAPEPPRRGIDGAWDYLCARRGIVFGLSASGRLALPSTHIAYEDMAVIEALGEQVIVGLLNGKPLRCDVPGHKGEAPVAFTIAKPFRLPVCEAHLLDTFKP